VATLSLAAIVVVLGLTLGACKRKPPPPPALPPLRSWSPPAAPVGSGPLASVTGLDLCAKTNLAPLADLKVKVKKAKSDTHGSDGADAACFFEMRTASGRDVSMHVAVTTFKSVEDAKHFFGIHRKFRQEGPMKYDGSLNGIGEEADGFSLQTEKREYQKAEYLILARFENRHVEAWVEVFDKPLIAKATLAEKARAILQGTAELAAKYEPP
jgi:hypothetical protein